MTAPGMTPEAAVAALGMMALRYSPRPMPWTDSAADDTVRRAAMLAWVDVMARYPAAAVLAAVEQVCTEQPTWSPNLNEFQQAIQGAARTQASAEGARRSLQAAWRCEGTGWLERDTGLEPCPTCNPFLRDEWKAGRWADNTHTRDARRKAWVDTNGAPPPACQPRPMGVPTPPSTGRALAWRAYVDACAEAGTQPDTKRWAAWTQDGVA